MTSSYDGYRYRVLSKLAGAVARPHSAGRRDPDHDQRLCFPTLEVGFAWYDPDAAIEHAKAHIDRFKHRWETPGAVQVA